MTRTTHGHHIPGTTTGDEVNELEVQNCLGMAGCGTCMEEAFAHPLYRPVDAVNHPAHYGGEDDPYEIIKVIEAWGLNFHLGNAVKYIPRAGKKAPNKHIEDLEKAVWYLNREIQKLKKS